MANFYDISSWEEIGWYNTGGTRNKAVFENPTDSSLHFFKTSLKKLDKDFKYEFWSEIIASEIGLYFGFNTLKYDIAFNGLELGCISQSMINENECLIEGYRYLIRFDTSYSHKDKKAYTFQFIIRALEGKGLGRYIDELIKIIVFDSIIGNGDRHQENWGFIESKNPSDDPNSQYPLFAPIYDSGSCLGREIVDHKIKQMLSDEAMIKAYISRGKSEIHWEGSKINHFELVEKIIAIERFRQLVIGEINRVKHCFDPGVIEEIVRRIDVELPSSFAHEKIPAERKKLIVKLITLRCEHLISLLK